MPLIHSFPFLTQCYLLHWLWGCGHAAGGVALGRGARRARTFKAYVAALLPAADGRSQAETCPGGWPAALLCEPVRAPLLRMRAGQDSGSAAVLAAQCREARGQGWTDAVEAGRLWCGWILSPLGKWQLRAPACPGQSAHGHP